MADGSGKAQDATPPDLAAEVRRIGGLIANKSGAEAAAASARLVAAQPRLVDGWLIHARASQAVGALETMRDAAEKACALAAGPKTGFVLAEACLISGDSTRALTVLDAIEQGAANDYPTLRRLTDLYTQCGMFEGAGRAARAAAALRPDDPDTLFNLAPPSLAVGRLDEAEGALDRVLALRPDDWEAHYLRATLRKQTPENNHIAVLEAALARGRGDPRAETAVGYALGKELEDIGRIEEAFGFLALAAAARRKRMAYKVEMDEGAMAEITAAFNAVYCSRPLEGFEDEAPIFIVGMPRSGTTLVDRILSQHSKVESRGELNDLALAITRATPSANNKSRRIAAAAEIEPRALGEAYARSLRGWGAGPVHLIDKAPLNFLYIGLIARALPNARIVHVTRHPMASGYAMFKTYFRMGYPFSYDLEEIARYLVAYSRLMQHWRAVLPGRVLDVAYEDVVDDIEGQTRRLLDHCGLAFEPACVAFHENKSPSATASAAQVRRPLYRDSLEHWRRIEPRLAPLERALKDGGLL
ncbi:sulfotransferase [Terricaulis sp.]|uniref:tetratricopeptide repeat-containing sulfotransferase family protein n=1 Tax=Terricaulis sp. TaxID=2768686 RepID=UPI00378483F6